mmetsp:Transcript_81461/g.162036  ORF Transcript_81461/g.162036 Transcript_81461/m.162036 type:complete len:265 (-) Transcript_81461:2466-3260(-)
MYFVLARSRLVLLVVILGVKHGDALEVKRRRRGALIAPVAVGAHKLVRHVVELVLERNDNELQRAILRALTNVLGNLRDVDVVEGGVDLVHHEEGRGAEAVDREEQREGGDSALAARELVHVAESLTSGHGRILGAVQVGFIRVLEREVGGAALQHALDLGEVLVHLVDGLADRLEGRHEFLVPLGPRGRKARRYRLGCRARGVEFALDRVQPPLHFFVLRDRLHIRSHPVNLLAHLGNLARQIAIHAGNHAPVGLRGARVFLD